MSSSFIPNTGDPRVDAAFGRIRKKFTDLEDAMMVHAQLEKRLGDRAEEIQQVLALQNKTLQSHNQLLADHEDMVREHTAANKSHEAFRLEHEEWMKHMQDKLDALTGIVMRREGGSEAEL